MPYYVYLSIHMQMSRNELMLYIGSMEHQVQEAEVRASVYM